MPEFGSAAFNYRGLARYRNLEDGSILAVDARDDSEGFLAALLDELQRYIHARQHPATLRIEYQGEGTSLLVAFPDACCVVINRGVMLDRSPGLVTHALRDFVVLRLQILGEIHGSVDEKSYTRGEAQCSFIHTGAGVRWGMDLPGGEHWKSVAILFRPELLADFVPVTLLAQLGLFEGGRPTREPQFFEFPATSEMLLIGARLLDLEESAVSVPMMTRGLGLQLIASGLEELTRTDRTSQAAVRLRSRDLERLLAVRRHMDASLDGSHTIVGLSRFGGINRRKLTEGFRALFGTTVAEYLVMQRMALARQLLEGGVSVTQASERVGYRDRTSFSRAFSRVTGQTPSAVRRARP